MKKIAIILSGCGVYDGSEIHEAVLTLLHLDRRGAAYQCFAPDIAQTDVVDHVTGKDCGESRNVLTESARIARGEIKPLEELHVQDFDAMIIPGGFGAAKNLCDYATAGSDLTVLPGLKHVAQRFREYGKPLGLICIAPVMSAALLDPGVHCTTGKDPETAATVNATGAVHTGCAVEEIVVDPQHKLVTTPAYMLATRIREADAGIAKLVDKVLEMT